LAPVQGLQFLRTVTVPGGGSYFFTRMVNVNPNKWNVKVIGMYSPPFGSEGRTACRCLQCPAAFQQQR
jgi:hypothetical protein